MNDSIAPPSSVYLLLSFRSHETMMSNKPKMIPRKKSDFVPLWEPPFIILDVAKKHQVNL